MANISPMNPSGEGPATAPAVSPISMDPARVDDNAGYLRKTVQPEIKSRPEFRLLRYMMDRASGTSMIGLVMADAESLRTQVTEMRSPENDARRAARGVELGEPKVREILFAEFR